MFGHEGVREDQRVAAGPPHPHGEPAVLNGEVGPRHGEEPHLGAYVGILRALRRHRRAGQRPVGEVHPADVLPLPAQQPAPGHRLRLAGRHERTGQQHVRPVRPDLRLPLLGEERRVPPGVRGQRGRPPRRRAALAHQADRGGQFGEPTGLAAMGHRYEVPREPGVQHRPHHLGREPPRGLRLLRVPGRDLRDHRRPGHDRRLLALRHPAHHLRRERRECPRPHPPPTAPRPETTRPARKRDTGSGKRLPGTPKGAPGSLRAPPRSYD